MTVSFTTKIFFSHSSLQNCETLADCLKHFTHKEILDGSNMYKCEKCRRQTRAIKSLKIHRPPNVLAISLKRFNVFGNKIGRQIQFPPKLNLANFCSNSKVDHWYELYASLVHDGHTANSGHYYSYCKTHRGSWCRYVLSVYL